jgi:hypothetical protein
VAGRRIAITWQEADTPEALQEAYRTEPRGEVRTRLHGLWLVRQGWTMAAVAPVVGVD